MRLKVQTIKTLVWFAIALLVAAIIGLLVYIFLNVVPVIKDSNKKRSKDLASKIQKAMDVQPTIKARERSAGIDGSQLENLRLLNVTGRDPPPPPVEVDPNERDRPPPLKPITEVLSVSQVIVSALDPKRSFAAVKYLGEAASVTPPPAPQPAPGVPGKRHDPKTLEGYVEVGTVLKSPYDKDPFNGKVSAILEDGVEFEWGGEKVKLEPPKLSNEVGEVRLMPGMNDDGGAIAPVEGGAAAETSPRREAPKPATAESTAIGENDWYIGTEELARLDQEGEELLNEIEISPAFIKSENKMRLQLKKVPEGSLAHQRGFRDGDVLRSINGQEMSKKASIVDYVKSNPTQTKFTIELERLGSKVTKVFTLAR